MILQIVLAIGAVIALEGTLQSMRIGDLEGTLAWLLFWIYLALSAIMLLTTPARYLPFFNITLAITIVLALIFRFEVYQFALDYFDVDPIRNYAKAMGLECSQVEKVVIKRARRFFKHLK